MFEVGEELWLFEVGKSYGCLKLWKSCGCLKLIAEKKLQLEDILQILSEIYDTDGGNISPTSVILQ